MMEKQMRKNDFIEYENENDMIEKIEDFLKTKLIS